jgi:hypothetical protein
VIWRDPLRRAVLWALTVALAAFLGQPLAAQSAAVPRIVAIGDIHGAIGPLRDLLQQTGLTDAEDRWVGGTSILVQTGDLLDRGADVRAVVALLARLQPEARAAGGQVISLLGNHEGMNLARVYRDVGPEAYSRFIDEKSEKRRKRAYADWQRLIRNRAALRGGRPQFTPEIREAWFEAHPLGSLEYRAALEPNGEMGAWLRNRDTVVQVGDTIFLHGGIGPELEDRSLDEINRLIAEEIAEIDRLRGELEEEHALLPYFDRGESLAVLGSAPEGDTEPPAPATAAAELEAEARDTFRGLTDSWMFRAGGPLWFRGYAQWSDEELAPLIERVLAAHGARRIVAGHTPSESARIVRRLEDRVVLIDTGMYWSTGGNGAASALEIVGDRIREVYLGATAASEAPAEPAGALLSRAELLAAYGPSETAPTPGGSQETPPRVLLGPDGAPLPFTSDQEILDFLSSAEIVEWAYVGEGVTRPRRIVLEKDGFRLRGIFHDVHTVKERVRLPSRGILLNYKDSYTSQVAGYRVAMLLGLDNVPPAVARDWGREHGSAALWIEGAQTEGERLAKGEDPPFPLVYQHRFFDLRVFDNLINNTDRNQGNLVFDAAGKLWFIDHTRAFGSSKQLPDPDLVTHCSRPLWDALRALDPAAVDEQLSELLSRSERRALFERRDRIVALLEKRIERLGEGQVLFTTGDPFWSVHVTTQP